MHTSSDIDPGPAAPPAAGPDQADPIVEWGAVVRTDTAALGEDDRAGRDASGSIPVIVVGTTIALGALSMLIVRSSARRRMTLRGAA